MDGTPATYGHAPPIDIELEQSVLAAILADNAVLDRVDLAPEDFGDGVHRAILAAVGDMRARGIAASPATLRPYIGGIEIGSALTTSEYLLRLIRVAPQAAHVTGLVRELHMFAARRRLLDLSHDLALAAMQPQGVKDVALHAIEQIDLVLTGIRERRQSVAFAGDASRRLVERARSNDFIKPYPTGLKSLDRVLGGWKRQEMAVVGARPAMGKSAFGLSTARRLAESGHGTIFYSLEMSQDQVSARLMSDAYYNRMSPMRYGDILRGDVGANDLDRMDQASRGLAEIPLIIDDARGLTISEVSSRTRLIADKMAANGGRLDVVIVDYLALVKPSDRYRGNRVHEVTEISAGLTTIAREMDLAVVALAQLNRAAEGRDIKRPQLSDLRDSGSIEQDADSVSFLYRPAYYLEQQKFDADSEEERFRLDELARKKNVLEYIVAKNRTGPSTTIELFCDLASNRIDDMHE